MPAGKNILLISPQPWGGMHISKHHYANALTALGYTVYFLNPPVKENRISVNQAKDNDRLFVIDSGFSNPLVLRYHFRAAYNILAKRWMRQVLRSIPPAAAIWCFDTNTISDMAWFSGAKKIFHAVDPVDKRMIGAAKKADLVVCVSNRILSQFESIKVQKEFINHALSDHAICSAKKMEIHPHITGIKTRIGYAGNLFRQIIDTAVIAAIVKQHPGIEFHFWGANKVDDNNLGNEDRSMLHELQSLSNVFFHGAVPAADLIQSMNEMDGFLLVYKAVEGFYDSSNSHKLLEYWATGKVVISTYIDQYSSADFEKFIAMSRENENGQLPSVFNKVINELEHWNSPDNMKMRKDFALTQSYTVNTKKILSSVGIL